MTNPRYSAVTDVYAWMFFCDFIAFLIIVFGYWAFGPVVSKRVVLYQDPEKILRKFWYLNVSMVYQGW